MADAVAEFYDPTTGRLQASGNMVGFFCRRSSTVNARSRLGGNTNPSTILVPTQGFQRPVVALRMPDGYTAALAASTYNPDTGKNDIMNFASNVPVGTTITYYIFEWAVELPANSGLFQLRNTANQCMFSSGYWPMKLVTALKNEENDIGQSFSNPGRTLAFAFSNAGGHSRAYNVYCYRDRDGLVPNNPKPGENLDGCQEVRGDIDGKLYGAKNDNNSKVTGAIVSWDDVSGTFGSYDDYTNGYGEGWAVANTVMVIDVTYIPVGVNFF